MDTLHIPTKNLGQVPLPKAESAGAAGADLRAALAEPLTMHPGQRVVVPSGIAVAVPAGHVALVFARSGLAARFGISLANGVGVIDCDYRGEIGIALSHQGDKPYTLSPGERIAQLVLLPVCKAIFEEVAQLPETDRGEGGFGSTGQG